MIEFLYDICYMLPLNIALILNYAIYMHQDERGFAGCIFGLAIILLLMLLRHCGKKERYLIIGIGCAFVVSLAIILGEERRLILFEKYNWLLWVILVTAVSIISGWIAQKSLIFKAIVSTLLMGSSVYMMLSKLDVFDALPVFSVLTVIVYLLEIIQTGWKKSGETNIKAHVALVMPVIILLCITVIAVPKPEKPFEWRLAKNIWKATVTEYKRFVGLISAGGEEYGYTGFSEASSFESRISGNDKEVMLISSDKKSFDKLYMGGVAYNSFDGRSWKNDELREQDYRLFDVIETRCAINKSDLGYSRDFIREETIDIESRLYNTRFLFLPYKTNMESSHTLVPAYKEAENVLKTSKRIKYGDTYSLSFYQLNFANPDLFVMLDSSEPISMDEWEAMLRKAAIQDTSGFSYDNYQLYREHILEAYTEDIELTEAVAQLINGITDDANGDYEKLKAIAEYLQGMEYNVSPGPVPSYVDDSSKFLEYFLIESPKGYCVHYATAFSLLARQMGYPSRYVQGYYVKKGKEADTLVTQRRAHAWVEVYFDNFGWIPFETTPGYSMLKGWTVQKKVDTGGMEMSLVPYGNEIIEESDDLQQQEPAATEPKRSFNVLYVLFPLAGALFFGVMYIVIFRIVSDYRFQRMNAEKQMVYLMNRNFRLLKVIGIELEPNETLNEFRIRAAGIVDNEEVVSAMAVLKQYERQLYSDYVPSERDLEAAAILQVALKNVLKDKGMGYRLLFA